MFDALFWPIHWMSPEWQVAVLGLPAALLALLVYRISSDQAAIRDAKAKIVAHLLELRLFRDDLRVLFTAEGKVLAHIARYLGYSLVPMVVMLPVFLLILIQIESRYAFRGLAPGEEALVTVRYLSKQPVSSVPINIETDAGLRVATPALRADASGEIYWRVHAVASGTHELQLRLDGELARRLVVADASDAAMSTSYRADDVRSLLYPKNAPLPSEGRIAALVIDYPRARGELAGLSSTSWLFFGMVMLYAFALRGVFDVSF
jgi:hypothetical protein